MSPKPSLRHAFAVNLGPALMLWSLAATLLALYYNVESSRVALNALAAFKEQHGLWFVMPAQVFAALLMPYAFQRLQRGSGRSGIPLAQFPFLVVFWALQGAMINGFYEGQAMVFGSAPNTATTLVKVAVDMFLFTPALFIPLVVWSFAFKDNGYSLRGAARAMGPRWYRDKVLPVYLAALIVWTPTVCVMYSLPLALQFPVQAIVQCFWALLLVILTRKVAPPANVSLSTTPGSELNPGPSGSLKPAPSEVI